MARKKRNYSEEYARRIERAKARGLSLSQARGHPGPGESLISSKRRKPKKHKPDKTLQAAIDAIRKGETMTGAAKRLHVSRERLSAYAKRQAGAKRKGRS